MNTIIIEQNVPAKMRDGVVLMADIFRPAEAGQFPVLLTRLPYGKELMLSSAIQWMDILRAVRSGYVVILQDCRGTFASEGKFEYCFHEGKDGYDMVEWAAALPYSTGAVGMFGVSYLGWTQWSAAGLRPPHLKAIAPGQTWSDFSGMRFRGGAFELADDLQWRMQMSMGKLTRELPAERRSAEEINNILLSIVDYMDKLNQGGFSEVPLRHLKSMEKLGLANIIGVLLDLGPGNQAPGFRIEYSDIEVPSLNLAGWYDVFQQYTIDNYVGSRTLGRDAARHSHLLVGPWTHGQVVAMPGMTVGEINFGTMASGAMVDLTGIQLRWFDRWLKDINNGVENDPPVRLFLTGENSWINMPDWPPRDIKEQKLYLSSGGTLNFSVPGPDSGSSSYNYNPADPAPTLGGNTLLIAAPGVKDQRPLSARSDVLTFRGAPLEEPLQVIGRITADLWVSSSAPDTDFVVRLIDVYPDGYMHNLCDGILRVRYRQSLKEPSWMRNDQIYELKVDLWSMAHVFKLGHRIAVQVTSSSFPRWDRNWNTTEDPGSATAGQIAHQKIWHDSNYPSGVLLPVLVR
jgi:putative CocE/NonD family hydrolase